MRLKRKTTALKTYSVMTPSVPKLNSIFLKVHVPFSTQSESRRRDRESRSCINDIIRYYLTWKTFFDLILNCGTVTKFALSTFDGQIFIYYDLKQRLSLLSALSQHCTCVHSIMSSEIGRDYVMIFIVKSEWLHKSFAKYYLHINV